MQAASVEISRAVNVLAANNMHNNMYTPQVSAHMTKRQANTSHTLNAHATMSKHILGTRARASMHITGDYVCKRLRKSNVNHFLRRNNECKHTKASKDAHCRAMACAAMTAVPILAPYEVITV